MGVVHLARSPAGRQVALKVIRPEYADDPDFRARFRREVAAARKVSGAFTASVVDADPDGDPPWLATQYVPGPSLAARVREGGPLARADCARLAGQLAEALRDIHRQGIVHRDLKPANVLLADDGVRVIDFGVARSLVQSRALTRTGSMVGTPAFMAPEQLSAPHSVSSATDVFALGCVVAFAAIGRSPFEDPRAAGMEPIAVAFAVVHGEPDLTGITGPLRELVAGCLAKDPARRPGVDEVVRRAARLRESVSGDTGGDAVGGPPGRRRRRARILAAALAVLAAGWLFPGDAPIPRLRSGCGPGMRGIQEGATHSCVGLLRDAAASSRLLPAGDRDLAAALDRVTAQNSEVVQASRKPGGRPFVSVVYMTPITAEYDGTALMESVRHDLEGAFLAQFALNRQAADVAGVGIRVLFAQTGGTAEQRHYTVEQILAHRRADRIVAAVGLGGSTAASQDMVGELTAGGLPAFASVMTADSWAGTPGLVRVAAPNADEAAAAVRFLGTGRMARERVLFVQDVATGDQYTSTLATQFRNRMPPARMVAAEPVLFDSSRPGMAATFRAQVAALCAARAEVVYFAGRGTSLPPFLQALAVRPCRDHRVTVLSGDDTITATQTPGFSSSVLAATLREGRIDLVYTGLAHPAAWKVDPGAFSPQAIAPFVDGTFTSSFPQEDLQDGRAIMMYDAVLTAFQAVRDSPAVAEQPTAADVYRTLADLRRSPALPGASGWIAIGEDGGPRDKAIPLIRIGPDGRTTAIAVLTADGRSPAAPAFQPG